MECLINEDGFLYIKRAGKWKSQNCLNHADAAQCGDWCPAFQEENETILGKFIITCTGTRLQLREDERDQVEE